MRHNTRTSIGVDAETAATELRNHYHRHGRITPRALVDEAEPDDAPLHPCFEWDDEVAGDKYRLLQARKLVRAVRVVTDKGEDVGCAFVHATTEQHGNAYHPVEVIARRPDLFSSALSELLRKLAGARSAVEDLERHAGGDDTRREAARVAAASIDQAQTVLESAAAE